MIVMNRHLLRIPLLCICLLVLTSCKTKVSPHSVQDQGPPDDHASALPEPPPPAPETHPACDDEKPDLTENPCEMVSAWQPCDPAWVDESSVIFVAVLDEYEYPCVFHEDGSSDMILARSFQVEKVLAGQVKVPAVNISMIPQEDQPVPEQFAEGRRYLVLMDAADDTLELLADASTAWNLANEPHASEVVAMVDLSQSAQEAEALTTQASLSGEHDGFTFDPQKWEALRSAEDNDLQEQQQFLQFIQAQVLTEGATLGQVRSWLGEPDHWWMNAHGIAHRWNLHRRSSTDPAKDMISIRLETWFDTDLTLVTWKVDVLRCTRADETGDAWIMLEPADLAPLGLAPMYGP